MLEPPNHPEIGRELKVSELPAPPGIVWVAKASNPAVATLRVVNVSEGHVHLIGIPKEGPEMHLLLFRCGADLEQVTDDTHVPMAMYEYLGADK